jgi:hypothetical protein
MKKFKYFSIILCAGTLLLDLRDILAETPTSQPKFTMVASFTNDPVRIDGLLDDRVWSTAESYQLSLSNEAEERSPSLNEGGTVKAAVDDQYLYIGVDFKDSDLVAEGDRDQLHHNLFGDVTEVFIKPANQTWYWELYVTPNGMKTNFFIPGRGRLPIPSNFADAGTKLRVAAKNDGSINQWRDKDVGWTAELAFPLSELSVTEDKPDLDQLTILIARYNYSRYLEKAELSSWPKLKLTDFHKYEEYGKLRLSSE